MMLFCALLVLVMIVDYFFMGETLVEEVQAIHKSLEKYRNAGGNYHYSFSIQTKAHEFSVSESFASLAKEGQELKIEVSPLFNEVNSVKIIETGNKEIHSLRIFSGLIFPTIALLIVILGFRYGAKVSILVFVIEAGTIANLLYLLN